MKFKSQVGMLYQQENDFGKWYMQLALVLNPDFRKKTTSKSTIVTSLNQNVAP